jgi:hypothetical protein
VELLCVVSERSWSEETVENSDRSVWNDKTGVIESKRVRFDTSLLGEEHISPLRFLITLQWLQISVAAPMHCFE